ncbi:DUF2357 domain-containing protein [Bacillus sp. Cr_A10]|uniref:DUF2357 domain-containing protein n=1 Tax=Bacillus sp. Cr_A10 TaxID=3033993 RepID=UPI0023D9D180|nr:DUF2357 domain-containing protein [Bacillus sp. Cr_A10]MDF2064945.1 DUF2357 domain-containing protein [Bacillus sp. Cr_A10]
MNQEISINVNFRLFDKEGEVLKDGQPLFDQSVYRIEFEQELTKDQKTFIEANYTSILKSSFGAFYTLSLSNYVGSINLFGKLFEVLSKKWNKKQIEYLYKEVSKQASNLPFYSLSVANQSFEKNLGNHSLIRYHQWILLREELFHSTVLKDAWDSIVKEPHTMIISQYQSTEPWKISRVDETSWNRFIQKGNVVELRGNHPLASKEVARKLARNGSVYFPKILDESVKRKSYDTKENRFIKNMLIQYLELVEWFDTYLRKQMKLRSIHQLDDVHRINQAMKKDIQNKLETSLMKEVSLTFTNTLGDSTILQRRQGYRQWFVFYQTFIQGIGYPMTKEELQNRIETKSIDKIYEMWCFFEIEKALSRVIGNPSIVSIFNSNPDTGVYLGKIPKITYLFGEETLELYYNKTFSTGESYSVELRPDISIYWHEQWYHFDAKYKLSDTYKIEDIHKMHVYKDAIHNTRLALALYPAADGYKDEFFEDPIVNGGIGVVHLMIDIDNTHLDQIIQSIIIEGKIGRQFR